jgi:hypothetical protein
MESVNNNSSRQTQRKASCLNSLNNTSLAGDEVHRCVSGLPFRRFSVIVTDLLQGTSNKEVDVECSADNFLSMGVKLGNELTTYFKICGLLKLI